MFHVATRHESYESYNSCSQWFCQLLVKSDLFISCEEPDGHRSDHGCVCVGVCVYCNANVFAELHESTYQGRCAVNLCDSILCEGWE